VALRTKIFQLPAFVIGREKCTESPAPNVATTSGSGIGAAGVLDGTTVSARNMPLSRW
jgi:hypothetical protein